MRTERQSRIPAAISLFAAFLLLLLLLPITGGIIGAKYFGILANFVLMMALFNVALTFIHLMISGDFQSLLLIPGAGIFPMVVVFQEYLQEV